jgi:hypothetical protein
MAGPGREGPAGFLAGDQVELGNHRRRRDRGPGDSDLRLPAKPLRLINGVGEQFFNLDLHSPWRAVHATADEPPGLRVT